MKEIIAFILLVLSFVGVVGGVGYTLYYGGWPISIGILGVGYLAWPKIKECWNTLIKTE